jgi:predicted pyridoxine 5'-phosphate oxidase superfamily flavin-nucleotide-binding protein
MAIKVNKGNNKITELRTILQRESQNSYVYKQTKSVNTRKTVKTVMANTTLLHKSIHG